jgi:hypothetical protein
MRVVSPRTWLRITTLEQTLLDTLLQPLRCVGEAVVLEAWENGVSEGKNGEVFPVGFLACQGERRL